MLVMGGVQPIYGSSLETNDWDCGTLQVANWSSTLYPGNYVYINITIPTDQINKTGRTQFELKSNREGIQPCGPDKAEYIIFQSDVTGVPPMLEITWLPNNFRYVDQYWYYWNSTGRDKLAIVLFGGYCDTLPPGNLQVWDLFCQDPQGDKEKLVCDLHLNGYDVLSPWHDQYYTNRTYYRGPGPEDFPDWLYNATVWAHQKGYHYLYLFGFSAGGVAVAYEIQKDYATVFSAAIVASAPVNLGPQAGFLYRSAENASKVKTCTSFIAGKDDFICGDIYNQTSIYFHNTNAHKDWHKWDNGHDIFAHMCLTHPNETVSDAVIAWYNKHSTPLRNPSFEDRLRDVWGTADWETPYDGWRELKGDINGDCIVDIGDITKIGLIWLSEVGDRNYDWRCDLNGDGIIDIGDGTIVILDCYKVTNCVDGAYSRYIEGGSGNCMWQWINGSIVDTLKSKQITFTFQFCPASVPPNSSYYMEADIWYYDFFGWTGFCGPRVYFNQTIWYTVAITVNLPKTARTAVQLSIYGRPEVTAWIDNTTLTIQP